jgi:cell filamentation protein, protein adenylyltransferase
VDADRLAASPVGQLVPVQGTDLRYGPYAVFAFFPAPLPESLDLSMATVNEVTRASSSLARLDQACEQLKEPGLLIRPALYREALDTSALEGTYGQLTEVLEAELPGAHFRSPETREIIGYVNAALNSFESVPASPVSTGLLSEAQATMFHGADRPPRDVGKVREHQVWIGPPGESILEARFVPLPGDDRLKASLEACIEWIEADNDWPPVLRAALAHYQFETLHPFGDGNGRIGRLLIILQLLRTDAIRYPAVTVSPWLLRHREEYQDQLLRVSCTGDWNPWVQFFCRGIVAQCDAVIAGAVKLTEWLAEARDRINQHRWSGVIYDVLTDLTQWPVTSIAAIAIRHRKTSTAAANIVSHLTDIGLLEEMTGRSYGRVFGAREVMRIVDDI